MPFEEALQQMPLYAKFLKDMLTRKNRYIHIDTIVVEGNCNVVIQHILPPKLSDPGSVTIPCSIGEVAVGDVGGRFFYWSRQADVIMLEFILGESCVVLSTFRSCFLDSFLFGHVNHRFRYM